MAELADEASGKETAVGNSLILTTSVISFLLNMESNSLFHTGIKVTGVLITEGSQFGSRFSSHIMKKTQFESDKNKFDCLRYI